MSLIDWLLYNENGQALLVVLGLVVLALLVPRRYDPAIRRRERLEREHAARRRR